MRNLSPNEIRFVQRYAKRNGVLISDVDPFETDYVTGLEHLHRGNRPDDFNALNDAQQQAVLAWIEKTFESASSIRSCPGSSYGLKHWFGNEGTCKQSWWHNPDGFYITNGQFKGAMLVAGYKPNHEDVCNPRYKVKLKQCVKHELRKYNKHGTPYTKSTDHGRVVEKVA